MQRILSDTILKILALETSTEFCSVALDLGEQTFHKEEIADRRHSEILLPMVHALLSETGLTLQQIDAIAFGAGPGSFTGLRIACGVAQGFAYALELPVIGISTLEAIAQQVGKQKIIVALDARMNEIYHAAYLKQSNNQWKIISEPTLCSPADAPSLKGNGWSGCGSGFDHYPEKLSERYQEQLQIIYPAIHPRAEEVAQLAVSKLISGNLITSPMNAAPIYLRNKVALKEKER